jgi:hypothetical protein
MRDEIDLPPPLQLKVFSNAGGICANAASASTALGIIGCGPHHLGRGNYWELRSRARSVRR